MVPKVDDFYRNSLNFIQVYCCLYSVVYCCLQGVVYCCLQNVMNFLKILGQENKGWDVANS